MKRKQIPFCVERSIYVVSRIKQEKSLSSAKFAEQVRRVYAECNALSDAPKEETLRAYLNGRRPIPFDSNNPKVPSYLMAIELAFPGAQRYFFHPLFNLLVGPVWMDTSRRLDLLKVPSIAIDVHRKRGEVEMADECEAYNASLVAEQKGKRVRKERPSDLQWIHSAMYAIECPVRDMLFTRGGLGVNRRRYRAVEDEMADLLKANSLDALASAVGVFLEGQEIDDLSRAIAAKTCAHQLLIGLQNDPAVKKILPAISRAVTIKLEDTSVRGVNMLDAMVTQYPQSWGIAFQLLREKGVQS